MADWFRWAADRSRRYTTSARTQAITSPICGKVVRMPLPVKLDMEPQRGSPQLGLRTSSQWNREKRLLVSGYNLRDSALELFGRRALADDAAEGGVARHFGVTPAPSHSTFRVQPDQTFGSLGDPPQDIGAR